MMPPASWLRHETQDSWLSKSSHTYAKFYFHMPVRATRFRIVMNCLSSFQYKSLNIMWNHYGDKTAVRSFFPEWYLLYWQDGNFIPKRTLAQDSGGITVTS